jgi:hypothetical protein
MVGVGRGELTDKAWAQIQPCCRQLAGRVGVGATTAWSSTASCGSCAPGPLAGPARALGVVLNDEGVDRNVEAATVHPRSAGAEYRIALSDTQAEPQEVQPLGTSPADGLQVGSMLSTSSAAAALSGQPATGTFTAILLARPLTIS